MEDTAQRPRLADRLMQAQAQPSIGALFGRLFRDAASLAQEEVDLAKAEIAEKASEAASGASELVAGGAIAFSGFLILLMAAANALMLFLPAEHAEWLAPLIVGGVVAAFGAVLLAKGKSDLKAKNLTPSRTLQSLRRDGQLVKEHLT